MAKGAFAPTVVITIFPQFVTSVNFFGKVVSAFLGVAIFFGSWPTALVGVHFNAAACALGTNEIEPTRKTNPITAVETLFTSYSHSIVAGGLLVTSNTTRFTSRTSFVIRVEIFSRTS